MPPSDHDPSMNRPEVVSPATIDELLGEVDQRVEYLPPPSPEGYGVINMAAVSDTGEPVGIFMSKTPLEHASNSATIFIRVDRSERPGDERNEHWLFYPDDDGGQLTKSKPVDITSEVVEEITARNEPGKEWVDAVQAYVADVRDKEREAGYSTASEADTRQLIELIKSGRIVKERPNPLKGVLRWLRTIIE